MMERKDIRPFRQLDDDRVLSSIARVIFRQLYPQPSRLHAHHGIELRIEVRRPPEHFRRNLIFLDGSPRVVQDVAGQIPQELAQRFRPMQHMAAREPVDLTKILLAFRQRPLVTPMVNRSVTTLTCACKPGLYEL